MALMQIIFVLHEEILFRGIVLYVLGRAWEHTQVGTIGSVVPTGVLFAVPHFVAVFMGTSRSAAGWLVVKTIIIAIWWGDWLCGVAASGLLYYCILSQMSW